MGTCIFKTNEIKKLVKHSLDCKEHSADWQGNKIPSLLFVHDHGIYCMSNGIPALKSDEKNNFVSYAKNCNPHTDIDYYENARDLVGGDDFVEIFEVDPDWKENCDHFKELHIKINKKTISLKFAKKV
jgi:hypothetical protein